MKKTYFVSYTIVDHGPSARRVGPFAGIGRTFFTTELPVGERVLKHIEENVVGPLLPAHMRATITNIVPVEGDGL